MSRFDLSRRRLVAGLAATPILGRPAVAQVDATAQRVHAELKEAKGTKLVLLGTGGGPVPGRARQMTSHVLLSEGAAYVVDCGLGVTSQLARTGIPFSALRSVFLTHHHPDHNIEYGALLVLGWTQGMRQDLRAFGPPPLQQMTEDLLRAYRATIGFWAEDFKLTPLAKIDVGEISAPGPVMQDDTVKVTAVVVEHPPVKPALAYRLDFKDRSIAFSGDTAPVDAVAQLAKGADVLVHEAIYLPAVEAYVQRRLALGEPGKLADYMAHMKASHTPAEEAGRLARQAGVRTLVLSHLVPADGVSDQAWRAAAATHFAGEIIVGQDLMIV